MKEFIKSNLKKSFEFKSILALFLTFIFALSTIETVYASPEDENLTDDEILCYADENQYLETCESINDPQYTYDDIDVIDEAEAGNFSNLDTMSPLSVNDFNEASDMTINLDSLPSGDILSENDYGNLKCMYPRSLIKGIGDQLCPDIGYAPIMQGACTDGTYYYCGFIIKDDNDIQYGSFIITCRLDELGTATINDVTVRTSENNNIAQLGHINSMTYNPLTGRIVVACGVPKNLVCEINASYLNGTSNNIVFKTHYIGCRASAIAYNEELNRYVVVAVSDSDPYCILDSNFNLISKYSPFEESDATAGMGRQGLYCDNNYIYSIYFLMGGRTSPYASYDVRNVLVIHNWSGELVQEINLSFNVVDRTQVPNEPSFDYYEVEHIIVNNDKVYLGLYMKYATGGSFIKHYYYYDLSSEFFHVKFKNNTDVSNLSSGSYKYMNVFYGVSTPLLKNSFTKTGYEFAGWNVFNPSTSKWSYKNSSGTYGWYYEGQEPSGYSKSVYRDKQKVLHTVAAGQTVIFCATWKATNKFYVSFNHNTGGSGTMASQAVTYGTSTTMPMNTFTKSGRTFEGWQIYNSDTSKWLYVESDGNTTMWCKEGTEPEGYVKRIYRDGTTIARTVPAGQHAVFYAQWNEFIVYYDPNGKEIKTNCIKTPTFAVYGAVNSVRQYSSSDLYNNESLTFGGYYAYRVEEHTWRYVSRTNSSVSGWYKKTDVDTSLYKLYTYSPNQTLERTTTIGKHIVLKAVWRTS